MHLYWRIQQDLDCLGETLVFHDPRFKRSFRAWIEKNRSGLAWTLDLSGRDLTRISHN